jgi:general transcription factor 3C polypeptide 3 (transcription factor C subunit 4)
MDIPKAMQVMQEVIRIEPRAAAAWVVLAQCNEDLAQQEADPERAKAAMGRGLQFRIMAAHLNYNPDEWERLASQSR